MARMFFAASIACLLVTGPALVQLPRPVVAYAQQADWKEEFDDICSKTDAPHALTKKELQGLIKRCDTLKPRIEKLDETTAKVYLRRLRMCRDLFAFALETQSE